MKKIYLWVLFATATNCFADIDCEKGASNAAQIYSCKNDMQEKKITTLVNGLVSKFTKTKNLGALNSIKESQAAWEKYRNGTCDLIRESIIYSFSGKKSNGLSGLTFQGESVNNAGVMCYLGMADERIKLLSELTKKFN